LIILVSLAATGQKFSLPSLQVTDPQKTFVAIVACEDYQSYREDYTENATHAVLDAERFMNYLIRERQIPSVNISYYPDALAAHIKLYLSKLERMAEKSSGTELIFYFSGKYILNKDDFSNTLLIPVDINPEDKMFAVSMNEVLSKLNTTQAKKVTIYIDAANASVSRTYSMLDKGEEPVTLDASYRKINVFIPKKSIPEPVTIATTPLEVLEIADRTAASAAVADKKPPALIITSPSEERLAAGSFTEKDIMIKGYAFDENGIAKIIVNGEEASLQPDNSFIAHALLVMGPNNFEVMATDVAGNVTTRAFSIERKQPPEQPAAETRTEEDKTRSIAAMSREAGYYALIIGVADYQNNEFLPDLDNPVIDAQKLYNVLTTVYSFPVENVIFLKNPNREAIIQAFDILEYKLGENDNLLIFYAGHGTWSETTQRGYWLPADASIKNTANWIDNSTITGYISGSKTLHTLVIADACFSGGIFKTRAALPQAPPAIERLYELSSRKAMTSGTLTEVPDKSVFMYYLVKNLEENQDKYLPAEQLFHSFKPTVLDNSSLIPQFGVIKNSGDEGGDFIFIRK